MRLAIVFAALFAAVLFEAWLLRRRYGRRRQNIAERFRSATTEAATDFSAHEADVAERIGQLVSAARDFAAAVRTCPDGGRLRVPLLQQTLLHEAAVMLGECVRKWCARGIQTELHMVDGLYELVEAALAWERASREVLLTEATKAAWDQLMYTAVAYGQNQSHVETRY